MYQYGSAGDLVSGGVLTGLRSLDSELGGLEPRLFYLIVGEEKSGRTTLALQLSLIASRGGREVLWLDCGGRLHPVRLKLMAEYWGADVSRIKISLPQTFMEQLRLLIWACDHVEEQGLIVVDDFTYLHRVEASGSPSRDMWIYRLLAFQAALLKEATRTRGVTAVAVSDVHERPGLGQPQPVAGAIVSYYSDGEIWLESVGAGSRLLRFRIGERQFSLRARIFGGGIVED